MRPFGASSSLGLRERKTMAGSGVAGNSVSVGDQITILGEVTAISGTGPNATVTVRTLVGDTITVKAKDCYAPQTDGPAISKSGKGFSVGAQVSIAADVTAVTGTGKSAVVTSTAHASSTSVSHAAATVHAPKKN